MADQPIRLTPLGNLDKDSDYNLVKEGNYVDALDVIKQDDEGQVSGSIQPTQRNRHAFSLGEVVAQNKKYRITVFPNSGANGNHAHHAITIKSLTGYAMVDYNGPIDYPEVTDSTAVQFTSTVTGFQSSWADTGNNNIFNVTYPILPGSTYPVIEIELAAYDYYDFIIQSVGPNTVSIDCIQEVIPTDLAGPLKDIGSYDMLGDLVIYSTTQDNDPTQADLTVAGVGPLALIGGQQYYAGPVTTISFTTDHNLQVGQAIRINNSEFDFLNGSFVVNNIINSQAIGVVTSLAWGGQDTDYPVTMASVGSEKITIHDKGFGEIGVAKKNNITGQWSYTRLLRSWELNFTSLHKIDSHAHEDATAKNFYYTDDYNPPRTLKYSGEYETDGALNFINNKNQYRYDAIDVLSNLIAASLPLKFSLVEQQQTSGGLMSGNKYYFARVVLAGGDISGWSSSSPAVPVYDVSYNAEPKALCGDKPSVVTTKANIINVFGNSLEYFEGAELEFAVLENIDGVLSATVFKKVVISKTANIQFKHTGNESGSYTLDIAELAFNSESYLPVKAKNIRSIDSRNVLSNVETLNKINLSEWCKTFKHSLKTIEIEEVTRYKSGEYQFAEASFNDKGFMLNETYRVGCRAYIKGIGKTDVFWVDDIKVDTNTINVSNPTDNRRVSNSILNYDLVIGDDGNQLRPSTYLDELNLGKYVDNYSWGNSGNPFDPGFENFSGIAWGVYDEIAPSAGWVGNNNQEFYRFAGGNTSISKLLVPRIVIEDIDFNYEIEGFGTAKTFVDALEFFIADVPKSVKASGLSVLSVKYNHDNALEDEDTNIVIFSRGFTSGTVYQEGLSQNDPTGYNEYFGRDSQLIYDVGTAVYEYPFATGSFNYEEVAVNYPLCTERASTDSNRSFSDKFTPVKDAVSFYSGDTYFDDITDFGSEKLIVFGAADLTKNWTTRDLLGGRLYDSRRLPEGAFPADEDTPQADDLRWKSYNKTNSFMSVWHPRGGLNKYKEITIKDFIYSDPGKDNDINNTGRGYNIFIGGGGGPLYGSNTLSMDVPGGVFTKVLPCSVGWLGSVFGNPAFSDNQGGNPGGIFDILNSGNWSYVQTQMNIARGPVISLEEEINLSDQAFSDSISPSFTNNKEVLRYSNRGVFYTQLYTNELSNYPNQVDTKYFSVGSMLLRPSVTSGILKHELLCGDTHTQTTVIKHRGPGSQDLFKTQRDFFVDSVDGDSEKRKQNNFAKMLMGTGFGSGLVFVGQNRVNSNMFAAPANVTQNQEDVDPFSYNDEIYYPIFEANTYLERFMFESLPKYNEAYNTTTDEIFAGAYQVDSRLGGATFDFPTRIMYSERKDQTGIYDEYRFFLPLNRRDLDRTFGEIQHHEDINGELFTLQDRKYQLQYFNTRGTLEGSNSGVEVVIGDGSVMSRDGQTLSAYGTSHKWSVVKGTSQGGKDVIYWFNQEFGLFMRFGADGTVVISDRHGIRSFSVSNTKWTEDQHTPALNYGIRSVWDDRFKEAIWTFIGIRQTSGDWAIGRKYTPGEIVIGSTNNNYPLDDIPDLYVCIANHISTEGNEPGNGSAQSGHNWAAVTKDDKDFYTVFTLAFNELSNGFSTFYSHLPKTYLKWKNKFLSSHPLHRNELYEHRYGYDKWYEYEGVWKESEPFIEGVVNYIPEQSKKFVAIQSLSDNVPDKIEFKTKNQESFLVAADFDPEDDAWRSPIKNDILTSPTSDPNDDTVALLGSYIRVKFKFFNGVKNRLNNMIIKIRARLRRTAS